LAIGIRKDLIERVRIIVQHSGLGYRSITEFVNDAVRRRIEELSPKTALVGAESGDVGALAPRKRADEAREKKVVSVVEG